MKVLVCIDNNLQNDARLKRHVSAIAEIAESVHVLARPNPNTKFGLDLPNVSYSFFDYEVDKMVKPKKIRKLLKQLNVYDEICKICPFLNYNEYYDAELMKAYQLYLKKCTESERWKDITGRQAEHMDEQPAMSYVVSFILSSIYMAEMASEIEADVVLCNDVDTLLCGIVHKKKYNSRIVYDIHDVTCDISPNVFPLIYSEMLMYYEKNLIQSVDTVMSVGDYLLSWVQYHYNILVPCVPIYSCGDKKYLQNVECKKFDNSEIRIYFHGAAYEARNLDVMVQALLEVEGIRLVFRCPLNEYMNGIKKLVTNLKLEHRVDFLDTVRSEDLILSANKDGDVGIYASVPEGCVNWTASFTNKFMEYLGAGLPIITTRTPDQSAVIEKYHCGFILQDDTIESMSKVYKEVLARKDELAIMARNAYKVGHEVFDWDIYKERLKRIITNDNIQDIQLEKICGEKAIDICQWECYEEQNDVKFESFLKKNNQIYKFMKKIIDFLCRSKRELV